MPDGTQQPGVLAAWRNMAGFDELSESWSGGGGGNKQKDTSASAASNNTVRTTKSVQRPAEMPSISSDPDISNLPAEEDAQESDRGQEAAAAAAPENHKTPRPAGRVGATSLSRLGLVQASTPPPASRIVNKLAEEPRPQAPSAAAPPPASPSSSDAKQGSRGGERGNSTGSVDEITPKATQQQQEEEKGEAEAEAEATVVHDSNASDLPPILRPAWQDGSPAKQCAAANNAKGLGPGAKGGMFGNLFSPSKLQMMFRTPSPEPGPKGKGKQDTAPAGSSCSPPSGPFQFQMPAQAAAPRFGSAAERHQADLRELKRIRLDGPRAAQEETGGAAATGMLTPPERELQPGLRASHAEGPQQRREPLPRLPSPSKKKSAQQPYEPRAAEQRHAQQGTATTRDWVNALGGNGAGPVMGGGGSAAARQLLKELKQGVFGEDETSITGLMSQSELAAPHAAAAQEREEDLETPKKRNYGARPTSTARTAAAAAPASAPDFESPRRLLSRLSRASSENRQMMEDSPQHASSQRRGGGNSPLRPLRRPLGPVATAMVNIRPEEFPSAELRNLAAGSKMQYDPKTMRWQRERGRGAVVEESVDAFAHLTTHAQTQNDSMLGEGDETVMPRTQREAEAEAEAKTPTTSPGKQGQHQHLEPPRSILKGAAAGRGGTPRRTYLDAPGNVSVSFADVPSPSREGRVAQMVAKFGVMGLDPAQEDEEEEGQRAPPRSGSRQSMLLRMSGASSVDSFKQYLAHQRALRGGGDETAWDATMLTEPSFAIGHDAVLQVLTDVVPWQPDWETLTLLDLSNRRVETLIRLHEFCPNLLDLNLNRNNLSHLKGLPPTIRHLQVAHNRLSSLTPFGKLNDLQTLDVSDNALESLGNLSALTTLRVLRADNVQASSLRGIEQLQSLESVSLQRNQIRIVDLNLVNWPHLQHLSVSHNELITLRGLERVLDLRSLKLDHNRLSRLDSLSALRKLRVLRVSGNSELQRLDVQGLKKLRTLYADFCDLRSIDHLGAAPELENLSLRSQASGSLRWPSELPRTLHRLFLSGNNLQGQLEGFAAATPRVNLDELVYLELAGCQLDRLPESLWRTMPNVRHLNLDYNLFRELPRLQALARLKRISLVSCRINTATGLARGVEKMRIESIDSRLNPCTTGMYAPVVLPTSSPDQELVIDPKAAPFPHPAVVQPDFARKRLEAEEEAAGNESDAHKSFFHKRLPLPPAGVSISAEGAAQTRRNEQVDRRFFPTLPEPAQAMRRLHRGILGLACPRLQFLDGLPVREEEAQEARRLIDRL